MRGLVLIFCLVIPTALKATNVEIHFIGKTRQPVKLSVFTSLNTVETRNLMEFSINSDSTIHCLFNLEKPQCLSFSTPSSGFEVFLSTDEDYKFTYDLTTKKWLTFGDEDSYNQLRWLAAQEFLNTTKFMSDSASYVSNFLKIFESESYQKLKDKGLEDNFNRAAFSLFSNHVMSRKLFKLDLSDSSHVSMMLLKWLAIENLDLELNSNTTFMALRTYYLRNSSQIFNEPASGDITYHYLFKKASEWIDRLSISNDLKVYLLGDFIQLYLNFAYDFDNQTGLFLENFLNVNPSSRHAEFIKKELISRADIANKMFEPQMVDINHIPFNFANVNEKIIYIDFWATWCGPCLEEHKYLEILEEQFSEKVLFLKVSIDDDEARWKASHEKFGIHASNSYILTKNDKEKIIDRFKLAAIPKFLIVDNLGNIIDSNPNRPSNSKLTNQLTELLNSRP